MNSGELDSCSDDNTIKLYNINKNEYKVIQTLNEHKNSVYKIIELKNKQLVSGSRDKSIIIYNNKTFKPDLTIKEHNIVNCVIQLSSGELVSCSYDNTINII